STGNPLIRYRVGVRIGRRNHCVLRGRGSLSYENAAQSQTCYAWKAHGLYSEAITMTTRIRIRLPLPTVMCRTVPGGTSGIGIPAVLFGATGTVVVAPPLGELI